MTVFRDGPALDAAARALGALAGGIIPGDERDGGAAAVQAGPRLAARMLAAGSDGAVYGEGVEVAERTAHELFDRQLDDLTPAQVATVLDRLAIATPRFFRQLRGDVAALYVSDPGVAARIGFPGPSLETGGYPDFDQPQTPGLGLDGGAERTAAPARDPREQLERGARHS